MWSESCKGNINSYNVNFERNLCAESGCSNSKTLPSSLNLLVILQYSYPLTYHFFQNLSFPSTFNFSFILCAPRTSQSSRYSFSEYPIMFFPLILFLIAFGYVSIFSCCVVKKFSWKKSIFSWKNIIFHDKICFFMKKIWFFSLLWHWEWWCWRW